MKRNLDFRAFMELSLYEDIRNGIHDQEGYIVSRIVVPYLFT